MNKVFTIRTAIIMYVLLLICITAKSQNNEFYCEGGLYARDSNNIQLRYVIDGRDWDCRFLTYYFVNGTTDVADTAEHNAVLNAMDSWSAVTKFDFLEVWNAVDADIRIFDVGPTFKMPYITGNPNDEKPFTIGEDRSYKFEITAVGGGSSESFGVQIIRPDRVAPNKSFY